MEYIIIGLLVIIILLQIIQLTKKQNHNDINEKLSRTEINVIKEISDFKHNFSSDLNNDFNNLNDRIERKLNLINQKVPVIIDIKDSKKIYKPLIKILDTYKGKITIQSFNPLILYYLKIKRPQYIRGYLIHNKLYSKQILSILKPTYIATNLKNLKNLC